MRLNIDPIGEHPFRFSRVHSEGYKSTKKKNSGSHITFIKVVIICILSTILQYLLLLLLLFCI